MPHILCTDDDPDTRDLLALLLIKAGFDVTCAQDATDCLTLAKSNEFDLFLIDNWMPGMSGVEVCKAIREFNQTTPILFCSAAGYERDKKEAFAAGAQGYVVKPVIPEILITDISTLLMRKTLVSE